ncbi:DNA helicase [Gordonia phage Chelms]|uniref:DNA helicase n=1 Tax=Gordonia phage Chelms TaxID=2588132 RepID=A0A4Y6ERA9_9CAUD|nr:helicase [Gordonia phage Chelms]QDF18219.1 DNA helicase [Gordonia phage Chelms]
MTDKKPNPILEMLKEKVAREEAEAAAKSQLETVESDAEVPSEFAEAAPEIWEDENDWRKQKAERQAEEDDALKSLKIRDVYERLTGRKVDPKRSGGKNEILVFCPSADHDNSNTEAACINTVKDTWVCYGQCDNGGGVVDMVAAARGLPYGKTSKGKEFAKAKQVTLEELCGWEFVREGKVYVGKSPATQQREAAEHGESYASQVAKAVEEVTPKPVSAQEVAEKLGFSLAGLDDDLPEMGPTSFSRKEFGADSVKDEPPAPVETPPASLAASPPSSEEVEEESTLVTSIATPVDTGDKLPEIENIFDNIPAGTPLYEYMRVVEEMSVPKEYSLFRGLQLLSLSAGPYLRGRVGRPFKTTLSVLFVGATGAGKSQSRRPMDEILDHIVYEWKPVPPSGRPHGTHTGVKRLIEPGSGEFLLESLSEEIEAGVRYKVMDVMADLEVDELSRFMGKGAVTGSSLVGIFQEMDNNAALDGAIRAGSKSSGTMIAINPNLVFSAGVQPKALPQLIGRGNIGNGLLARFEVVTGNKPPVGDPFDDKMKNTDHCQELYTDVAAYYMGKVDPQGKSVRKLFYLDVDYSARDLMRQCYQVVEVWKQGDDLKSRFDLKLYKLSTLFAVNRRADKVMAEDIKSAMWVMEYLNRATTVTGEKTILTLGNEIDDALKKVIRAFTESKGYVTFGTIQDKLKTRGWDSVEISRRLESLIERGDVQSAMGANTRGPKKPRYFDPEVAAMKQLKQGVATVTGITKNKKDQAK